MPPAATKSETAIFITKVSQLHKGIDISVIWKGIIGGICMQNMKS